MEWEQKREILSIARDIYLENLRKGKNAPQVESSFRSIVIQVKEGFDLLGKEEK